MTAHRSFWILTLALSGAGCTGVEGSGTAAESVRSVTGFSEVELSGAYDFDFEVAPTTRVVLKGDDNLLPLITTTVEGKRLRIRSDKDLDPKLELKVIIRAPSLEALECNGAVEAKLRGLGGKVLRIEANGAADIEVTGKVERLVINVTGAAEIEALGLEADVVVIDITGAGRVRVHANETLEVDITGAGEVEYAGEPKKVEKSVTGAGRIEAVRRAESD